MSRLQKLNKRIAESNSKLGILKRLTSTKGYFGDSDEKGIAAWEQSLQALRDERDAIQHESDERVAAGIIQLNFVRDPWE